jgi:hypothetical protein
MLLDPVWSAVEDPIERIFALLAAYRGMLVESEYFYGCPIGNLALEFKEPDPPIRAGIADNFKGWTAAVATCIDAAAARFPAALSAQQLATFVLTTMEGGVMLARTYRSIEPFDAAVSQLRNYFELLEQSARR